MCKWVVAIMLVAIVLLENVQVNAQKIKCYFNHPVNTGLSTGVYAVYVNNTFPDTIAAYINRSKYSIDFAIYNFSSNGKDSIAKIAAAINNAYSRGVQIRVVSDGSSSNNALKLINASIPRIASPTTSSYGIMHNKFVVIDVNSPNADDATVITGSYNFTQTQTGLDYNNILIIQDTGVTRAYYREFNKMWGSTTMVADTIASKFGPYKTTSSKHYFTVDGKLVQVHFSPKDTCGLYLKAVINSASKDLFFGIYAFTDNTVANSILNRKNAGVQVKGIMDNFSKIYTPYTILNNPLASNMVTYTGTGLYHNKIIIADATNRLSDPQVATGSFNWSASAQNLNDENLVIIHDSVIANQYYQSLCNDLGVNGGTPCGSTLPIVFSRFYLENSNPLGTFKLAWTTNISIGVHYFGIEYSEDGIHFAEQDRTPAYLDNKTSIYYSNALQNKSGYYRIVAVQSNEEKSYSSTLKIQIPKIEEAYIYPNPFNTDANLVLPEGIKAFQVMDILGNLIKTQTVNISKYNKLDLGNYPSGHYFVRIIRKNGKEQIIHCTKQ